VCCGEMRSEGRSEKMPVWASSVGPSGGTVQFGWLWCFGSKHATPARLLFKKKVETCLLETSNTKIGPRLNRIAISIEETANTGCDDGSFYLEEKRCENNALNSMSPNIAIRVPKWHNSGANCYIYESAL